jgi:uncharacterized protein YkwD
MSIVLRQRSSRLAGIVLVAAVSLGGVTGAQAAVTMPAQAPSFGIRALDGSASQDAFEAEVLRLTNEARSHSRKCGGKRMKAAKPLRWSDQLAASAHEHSADMATRDYFSHYSQSGASPFARIKSTGYRYRAAGENIAAGRSLADPAAVVQAWLKSPGHCKVLMNRKYKELGVGRVEGAGKWGVYWTQNFGARK